jgi:hypothetical protein
MALDRNRVHFDARASCLLGGLIQDLARGLLEQLPLGEEHGSRRHLHRGRYVPGVHQGSARRLAAEPL